MCLHEQRNVLPVKEGQQLEVRLGQSHQTSSSATLGLNYVSQIVKEQHTNIWQTQKRLPAVDLVNYLRRTAQGCCLLAVDACWLPQQPRKCHCLHTYS